MTDQIREYKGLVDRRGFVDLRGATPWDNEPDLVVGLYRGYAWAIIRTDGGYLNGYVAVIEGHPYYEKPYDEIAVQVHGGLTYAEKTIGQRNGLFEIKVKGYTSHSGVWWLGFDTAHAFDYCPGGLYGSTLLLPKRGEYRTYGYVYEEVVNLIRQCSEADGDGVDRAGPGLMPTVVFLAELEK